MGIGSALQRLIIARETNVNEVAIATGVNPQTLYSIIKRDSLKANIDDLYRVAHHLGVTLDYFYSFFLEQDGISDISVNGLDRMDLKVAHAYHSADAGMQSSVKKLLDVTDANDEELAIEREVASYRAELEAEAKGAAKSKASQTSKGA